MADTKCKFRGKRRNSTAIQQSRYGESIQGKRSNNDWWAIEPQLGRVAHGVANRVDRLKVIGNGQVSQVAATAWEILSDD